MSVRGPKRICSHGLPRVSDCHPCTKAYHRAWYRKNLEKCRKRNRDRAAARRIDPVKGAAIRQHDRDSARSVTLKRNYGLTPDEYERMRIAQGDLCAICGRHEVALMSTVRRDGTRARVRKNLSVDHDHSKGRGRHSVRGLLCQNCNWAISRIDAIPDWCDRALAYLARFSKEPVAV